MSVKKPKLGTITKNSGMVKIISRVTKATTKGGYLRTSIPQEIKEYLGIEFGDVLEWIPSEKNGERVVILRKIM